MGRPIFGPEESAAVARVLASGWVMQGPEVEAFENEFKEFVGSTHACAVSSGTAALHLALLAAGVRPGDEVITVSHSFIATANSIRHCGAVPVFVDIEPTSYNIDPLRIEAAISPRTRVILCVHQLGMPCDLAAIQRIATQYGLGLVEDAACAAGSEIRLEGEWQKIGRPHGVAACFSFHPRKLLTTGEGGMVTTDDPAIDERVRAWRSHGSRDGVIGFNYRMTDIQGAVGRVQLKRLTGLVAERRAFVNELRLRLPKLTFPTEPAWARSNWQSICVRLPTGMSPGALRSALDAKDIATRSAIINAHQTAEYCSPNIRLPVSERVEDECLLLPTPSQLSVDEIERLISALQDELGAAAH